MFSKDFIKNYLVRGLIAAIVYSVTVVIFLTQQRFQSIWLLFLGNALFMLAVATLVYLHNRQNKFSDSPVTSAISGHVLSFTGATLSVILSLLLYALFATGVVDGEKGEILKQVPAQMRESSSNHGMLFVLIVVAALGNTITGFFAAIFSSFGSSNNKMSENRSH